MKLHRIVDTRIVIACEILFPRHEDVLDLPEDLSLRDLWHFTYTSAREALRNGANYAMFEVADGDRRVFKIEAKDPYWYGVNRIAINHDTISR